MQTRKLPRKTITLPGRFFTGRGVPMDVTLKDLSTGGCRFESGSPQLTAGTALQIYIAGTGPHQARVKWQDQGEVGVTFARTLSDVEFASFESCHIPVHKGAPEVENFDAQALAAQPKPLRRFL